MDVEDIIKVVQTWKKEYEELGGHPNINYVQIIENKGEIMSCINPHPHGKIWSQRSIPPEISKNSAHFKHYLQLNSDEEQAFAEIIKNLCIIYDNIFETSFPYSSRIHQQPTDGKMHSEWHFHMSFYPPLLRSKIIKKFMVRYELFTSPQQDITAEQAAETIRDQSGIHYTFH